jgi:glycosyltransferase involved in cell wall biosynthesis
MKHPNRNKSPGKPRVLYIVTSAGTARLLRGQLAAISRAGFEVWIAAAPGAELDRRALEEGATSVVIHMHREPSPLADLRTLAKLWMEMRRIRPVVTNVGTPKAGFLGGLAAWFSGVPCRVYTLRGLRWETTCGLKRRALMAADWVACRVAHRVICVSASVQDRAVAAGIVKRNKTVVFGAGSSNGVNAAQFAPSPERLARAQVLRRELGIPPGAPVIGFIGRLTRDKGIAELVEAHARLSARWPELRLIIAGNPESGDALSEKVVAQIRDTPNILHIGPTDEVGPLYHLMDVLVLPSYREGFPNVVLEAGAAGKPVVAARATGTVDAVVDGVTGLLVPIADSTAIASALERVLGDPEFATTLGSDGRARVIMEFYQEHIWEALIAEYRALLERWEASPRRVAGSDRGSKSPCEGKRVPRCTP